MDHKLNRTTALKIIERFYDRVFVDPMIGHFFHNQDKQRLIHSQVRLSCHLVNQATLPDLRESMQKIHFPLNINGSQFLRRQVILKESMEEHDLDPELQRFWLEKEAGIRGWFVKFESCRR